MRACSARYGVKMQWTDRIGRRIKLHDLHVLLTTVEAGSMGRAAQKLNTSQPAISRAIADLEATLGVPLLERRPHGIEPTRYGLALLDTAASAFDSLRAGINHIGTMCDPTAGEIRIGGNEAMIAALLPTIMAPLRMRYPRIAVHVRHIVSAAQQYAELRERRLDLILGRVNLPGDEDAEVEILHHEQTHVVAGAGNPWSRRRRRFAFANLADEPWALPPLGTLVGALFAEAFRAHGVEYPPKRVVLGNIHVHCALVADGGFLALLPGSVVRVNADRLGLRILPVDSPVAASPVGLLYLRRREMPPVMSTFIECARESAKAFSHHAPPCRG